MPTIHTLGPNSTDSYHAACRLTAADPHYQGATIRCHDSFEAIYQNLAQWPGDYFLVPVAYQDASGTSWTNNNYRYSKVLKIVHTFAQPLLPLLLVENTAVQNQRMVLHAATDALREKLAAERGQAITAQYYSSKPLVAAAFASGQFQYGIFSEASFQDGADYQIIDRYQPEMVWCLYQIQAQQ
ncbi:hypothetical protein PT274_03555 [Leuconostocaceae bacterium ESL0958]|nr:hypothetical protein [Leuconostocaceae bacterium ESL0958]